MTSKNNSMCDVVVVGAGIGGLTAGALLARRGLSVRVFERRDVPGGCCSALEVDGHAFDIASSLFYGFGEHGFNANYRVMQELGVELDMFHHDPCFDMVFEGQTLSVYEDRDTWIAALSERFPSCAEGIKAFYDRVGQLYEDALRVGFMPVADASLFELTRVAFDNPTILFTYLPVLSQTVWSVLGPLLPPLESNPEVQRFKAMLDVDLAFGTCAPSHELPLLLAVPILMDRHVGGVRYPRGGAGAIARMLVDGLERHGGQIQFETSVRRVLVERGRAHGVELEDGTVVYADRVICNANIWDTFQELVDSDQLSRRRRREVEALTPSFSVFITCVSVDAEVVPDGFRNHTVVIPDHTTGLRDTSIIYAPSVDDPTLAPEGRHAVTLVNVVNYADWVPEGEQVAVDNPTLNKARVQRALELAEEVMPGISERSTVKGTFSPPRLEQTLRRRFGAVGGPEQNVKQSLNNRQGNLTEIDGLYLVGDSTFPGEGVVAVTISGMTCADQVERLHQQSKKTRRGWGFLGFRKGVG
ncbi:MAG: NAD(P)/FAD-dependent oxidoreductase [Myxococcota bacterium]